jgi:hypothetical protein
MDGINLACNSNVDPINGGFLLRFTSELFNFSITSESTFVTINTTREGTRSIHECLDCDSTIGTVLNYHKLLSVYH